jgi:hypothetical protein
MLTFPSLEIVYTSNPDQRLLGRQPCSLLAALDLRRGRRDGWRAA